MNNQVIIDYLAFTIKNDSTTELVGKAAEFHSFLESFCSTYCQPLNVYTGGHLYTKGYISMSGFRTYFGGTNTGRTLFVQISGSGCILIDQYFQGGILGFLNYILPYCPKIKRLDLAADEIGELDNSDEYNLTRERLEYCYLNSCCSGPSKSYNCVAPRSSLGKYTSGFTFYAGKRCSDVYMRIYDKKSEQKLNGPGHWMRCEIELHDDKAFQAFIILTSAEDLKSSLKEFYTGVCLKHIRFIKERLSNVTRSETCDWWTSFLDGCEVTFKFTQAHERKNIHSLMNWVDHSVLGPLKVVYETYGFEYLLKKMDEFVKDGRLSNAHKNMIEEFNREEQRIYDEYFSGSPGVSPGADTPQQQSFNIEVL